MSAGSPRALDTSIGLSDARLRRLEPALIVVAFVAMLVVLTHFATGIAGDSDPFGYVSEAILLSQGQILQPEHVFGLVGLPEDTFITSPVGFEPYTSSTLVPTYPFGYPLLMALGIRVAGLPAAYLVTPLLAAGTVVLTYLLGRIWLGRLGGLVAAFLVFIFPNFLYSSFMEWSDVPATFFAVLSLYLLFRPRAGKWSDLGLGAVLGYSVWVRPNMALLVAAVGVWLVWRRDWPRALRVGLALLPFVLVEGALNRYLYGAPWATGYGAVQFERSVADAGARLLRYLGRLNAGQAQIGLALVCLGALFSVVSRSVRILFLGIGVAFLVFFSFYAYPDDAWWYGRFLLPSFPALAVLEAGGLVRLLEAVVARVGEARRKHALAVAAAALLVFGLLSGQYAREGSTFRLQRIESNWVQPTQLAAEKVQQPAVVVSMAFSGSLRFYGHLATIRYDIAPADELIGRLRAFEQAGGHVYVFGQQNELDTMAKIQGGKLAPLLAGSEEVFRLEPSTITLRRLHVSSRASGGGS